MKMAAVMAGVAVCRCRIGCGSGWPRGGLGLAEGDFGLAAKTSECHVYVVDFVVVSPLVTGSVLAVTSDGVACLS